MQINSYVVMVFAKNDRWLKIITIVLNNLFFLIIYQSFQFLVFFYLSRKISQMNTKMYIPALLVMLLFIGSCTPKMTTSNQSGLQKAFPISSKNLAGKYFVRERELNEKVNENPKLSGPGSIEFIDGNRASYMAPGSDMRIGITYKIIGDKIVLDIQLYNEKEEFTVIDEKTLKDSEGSIYKAE